MMPVDSASVPSAAAVAQAALAATTMSALLSEASVLKAIDALRSGGPRRAKTTSVVAVVESLLGKTATKALLEEGYEVVRRVCVDLVARGVLVRYHRTLRANEEFRRPGDAKKPEELEEEAPAAAPAGAAASTGPSPARAAADGASTTAGVGAKRQMDGVDAKSSGSEAKDAVASTLSQAAPPSASATAKRQRRDTDDAGVDVASAAASSSSAFSAGASSSGSSAGSAYGASAGIAAAGTSTGMGFLADDDDATSTMERMSVPQFTES